MDKIPTAGQRVAGEIRAELARQRRTQTDLAAELGLSQPSVSQRLSGQVPMTVDEVARIADWRGVPVSVLVDAA